jgi:hypothetical protein
MSLSRGLGAVRFLLGEKKKDKKKIKKKIKKAKRGKTGEHPINL